MLIDLHWQMRHRKPDQPSLTHYCSVFVFFEEFQRLFHLCLLFINGECRHISRVQSEPLFFAFCTLYLRPFLIRSWRSKKKYARLFLDWHKGEQSSHRSRYNTIWSNILIYGLCLVSIYLKLYGDCYYSFSLVWKLSLKARTVSYFPAWYLDFRLCFVVGRTVI